MKVTVPATVDVTQDVLEENGNGNFETHHQMELFHKIVTPFIYY